MPKFVHVTIGMVADDWDNDNIADAVVYALVENCLPVKAVGMVEVEDASLVVGTTHEVGVPKFELGNS